MENNLPENKKILFFSPHPDDDVISAGALLYTLAKNNNNEVHSVYVTMSPRGVMGDISEKEKVKVRKNETKNACKVTGAKAIFLEFEKENLDDKKNIKKIFELLKKEKPDIVFLPPQNDAHPTHLKTARVVITALKSFKVKEVWFYDSWTPLPKPNFIFMFKEGLMKTKVRAIREHQSQMQRLDWVRAVKSLNVFRGEMGKELLDVNFSRGYSKVKQYGEAFFVVKK